MKLIVGKIYADWCPHCVHLTPSWKEMESQVKNDIQVVDFEAERNRSELETFQKTYPVNVQNGYPTLFRIEVNENSEPRIHYYTGKRDTTSLIHWAKHGDAPMKIVIPENNVKHKIQKKQKSKSKSKKIQNRRKTYRNKRK